MRLPLIFPGGSERLQCQLTKTGRWAKAATKIRFHRSTRHLDLLALHNEKIKFTLNAVLCFAFKTYSLVWNPAAAWTVFTYSFKPIAASLLSVWSTHKLAHTCCSPFSLPQPNSIVISPTVLSGWQQTAVGTKRAVWNKTDNQSLCSLSTHAENYTPGKRKSQQDLLVQVERSL